ncbi:DNA-binding protein [Scandinavium sp. NPDC088450]|uniref:DNA-binding protein n=1 Tax=Scandinavium sp. NPDC088450 TaxID=3364514 RepID=UPI00384F3B9D
MVSKSKIISDTDIGQLIDALNDVICEDDLLDRDERQLLVQSVAVLGGMRARINRRNTTTPETSGASSESTETQRTVDPRFPNAGTPWNEEDDALLHQIIDPLPDEDIASHVLWLAAKLGRTPYSVACKIVQGGRCSVSWRKPFKTITDELRASGMTIEQYTESPVGH